MDPTWWLQRRGGADMSVVPSGDITATVRIFTLTIDSSVLSAPPIRTAETPGPATVCRGAGRYGGVTSVSRRRRVGVALPLG